MSKKINKPSTRPLKGRPTVKIAKTAVPRPKKPAKKLEAQAKPTTVPKVEPPPQKPAKPTKPTKPVAAEAPSRRGGPMLGSLTQIAFEIGMDRITVQRRLDRANVKPYEKTTGYALFRMKDVIAVMFQGVGEDGEQNSEDIKDPFRRKSLVQAQREELKLAEEKSLLIPAEEVTLEQARVMKIIARGIETIPDILERDCGCPPEMLIKIEAELDKLRENLAKEMSAADAEPEDGGTAE